ncbi:DNA phosphorothioation-associated putative methyltransferase [Anaeromyxobacter sp. SG17]|uniref:DNA phosphorothioation-associated putative methyltransferase n=1 Tax=Anaeromyxobacter sp. SG17 TaxID=2925405 RepID=UPI001F5AC95C|nr:DNA phosphorothioation-associated putative methyltransferase [Anaeromyxobacter sp. SG17]
MEADEVGATRIRRERTALRRVTCSRPVALALGDGLIVPGTRVLDYGCGHGADVRFLAARGVQCTGWDPFFAPQSELSNAQVVNIGYVLNVIENSAERAEALRSAYGLAEDLLVVAVRVDRALDHGEPCADGVRTSRGTFQKLYTQDEFKEYIQQTLAARMHVASLGIGYVFRSESLEQRYLANKAFTRRLEYRADLFAEFAAHPVARELVRVATALGRFPGEAEFPELASLQEAFGSPQRLVRLVLSEVDRDAYTGSRVERQNDILVYLAMLRLQGIAAPPFKALPQPIQQDIKAIWGSYRAACTEGNRFLFSLGQPSVVRSACAASAVGKLLPTELYVHRSAEDELPALVRVLIFAARRVVGDVDYDIVKVSMDGRSVSFLSYPGFDDEGHPALVRSVKVHLPTARYDVRDYSSYANPPILHRKDALVTASYPRYRAFRELTDAEEAYGLLGQGEIGFRVGWEALLASRKLVVIGHALGSGTPA